MGLNEAEKWLKKLIGDRYVEPKEESHAMPSYYYSDPAESLDRIRGIRKAHERRLKKGKHG